MPLACTLRWMCLLAEAVSGVRAIRVVVCRGAEMLEVSPSLGNSRRVDSTFGRNISCQLSEHFRNLNLVVGVSGVVIVPLWRLPSHNLLVNLCVAIERILQEPAFGKFNSKVAPTEGREERKRLYIEHQSLTRIMEGNESQHATTWCNACNMLRSNPPCETESR